MRTKALLALAATVSAVAMAAPAHATRVCAAPGRVDFDLPLTTLQRSGTMTWTYNETCLAVETGGSSGLQFNSGTIIYNYDGSCLTANITGPGGSTGTLVGGLLMLRTDPDSVRLWALIPDSLNPCNFDTGTAVNAGVDL